MDEKVNHPFINTEEIYKHRLIIHQDRRIDKLPIIKDILKARPETLSDLYILKKVSYKRVYASIENNEFDKKLISISRQSTVNIVYSHTLDEIAEKFALYSIDKAMNISLMEFLKLPISDAGKYVQAAIEANKKITEIKKKAHNEDENLY